MTNRPMPVSPDFKSFSPELGLARTMHRGRWRKFAAAVAMAAFLAGCAQDSAPPPAPSAQSNPGAAEPGHQLLK